LASEAIAGLKQALERHPADRDILSALVSFRRGRAYAEQLTGDHAGHRGLMKKPPLRLRSATALPQYS